MGLMPFFQKTETESWGLPLMNGGLKSKFSKSLKRSSKPGFFWIVFWNLHSKRLQKMYSLQDCKEICLNHAYGKGWKSQNNISESDLFLCFFWKRKLILKFFFRKRQCNKKWSENWNQFYSTIYLSFESELLSIFFVGIFSIFNLLDWCYKFYW